MFAAIFARPSFRMALALVPPMTDTNPDVSPFLYRHGRNNAARSDLRGALGKRFITDEADLDHRLPGQPDRAPIPENDRGRNILATTREAQSFLRLPEQLKIGPRPRQSLSDPSVPQIRSIREETISILHTRTNR
jgi:hypothetical protein